MEEVLTQVDHYGSLEKFKQDRQLSGEELDKAVALAFGFKPSITWEIFNEDETATMIGFEREAEAIKWRDQRPSVHAGSHIGTIQHWPPFSQDLNLALDVLERVSTAYLIHKTSVPGRAREPCTASIIHGPRQCFAHGSTMAEAICRNALAATENKK